MRAGEFILKASFSSDFCPPTCHAGGEEISTGHRLDRDTRLTLQKTGDELRLHLLHHTGQAGLPRTNWWSLWGQKVVSRKTELARKTFLESPSNSGCWLKKIIINQPSETVIETSQRVSGLSVSYVLANFACFPDSLIKLYSQELSVLPVGNSSNCWWEFTDLSM